MLHDLRNKRELFELGKKITASQKIGEIGETAANLQFLRIGFQFDVRSRLEAGIDAIAEVMDGDEPTAKMIAVQVKATENARYAHETNKSFSYTVRSQDLNYWRGSNLPVILVLYRMTDDSYFWKSLENLAGSFERTLQFDKDTDRLDSRSKDRLAALTSLRRGMATTSHRWEVVKKPSSICFQWIFPQRYTLHKHS